MKLKIFIPEKLVLERDVVSVTMPGKAGQLTVLDGHDLLVAELISGPLFYRFPDQDGKLQREEWRVGDGTAEVTQQRAHVFVSAAQRAS